jgi:hypothetical protein
MTGPGGGSQRGARAGAQGRGRKATIKISLKMHLLKTKFEKDDDSLLTALPIDDIQDGRPLTRSNSTKSDPKSSVGVLGLVIRVC